MQMGMIGLGRMGAHSAATLDDTIERLLSKLAADDVVVDGENSYYRDDLPQRTKPAS